MNDKNYVENDPKGFCIAWCLWYVEMRIKNYETYPKDLIKISIKYINRKEEKFKDYIRNYSNYLDTKKNIILDKSGLPKKYWYRHHLPEDYYKKYLKYMRKRFSLIL